MTSVALFILASALISTIATEEGPLVTHRVTWEVSQGGSPLGTIVIGVFGEVAPKTVENFVQLASGDLDYGYKGSPFHRVIKDFMIQGGDFVNRDGTGSRSIYGGHFDDENFTLKHYAAGWLSMANAGENTNGCQFFITLVATPWLDGHHTVFGQVLEGMEVVYKIGDADTTATDAPTDEITITKSSVAKATDGLRVEIPVYEG